MDAHFCAGLTCSGGALTANAASINKVVRVDVALVGDALLGLQALHAAVQQRIARRPADAADGAALAAAARAAKQAFFAPLAASLERPIKPERVVDTLNRLLPARAIVVADPGTPCPYFTAYFDAPQAGRHFITNRAHGALGFAMSAGFGAAIGQPDSVVVAVMGDGSFGFTCGELETIVRRNVPLKMIVFSNSVFGWIKASQKSGYDERYFSVDFNRTHHARVAEAFGVTVRTLHHYDEIGLLTPSGRSEAGYRHYSPQDAHSLRFIRRARDLGFSVEQIVAVLKQAELGMPVADVIRQIGISEQTFYRWKKQYAGLQSDQVREFKQLQDENAWLKKVVAELTLDKVILQDIVPAYRRLHDFMRDEYLPATRRSVAPISSVRPGLLTVALYSSTTRTSALAPALCAICVAVRSMRWWMSFFMPSSYVRMVPVMATLSGTMFMRLPPWMAPTVTTAAACGSTLRDTRVCSAITMEAAATTTSVALCGMAPCPPWPRRVTVA